MSKLFSSLMFVWQFAFDSACLKEFFHVAEKNPATQALQCLSKFTFDVCYLVSHLLTPIYVYVVVLLSFCQDSIFIKKFNSDDNLSSMSLEPWTFGMRKDNNTTTYISKLWTEITYIPLILLLVVTVTWKELLYTRANFVRHLNSRVQIDQLSSLTKKCKYIKEYLKLTHRTGQHHHPKVRVNLQHDCCHIHANAGTSYSERIYNRHM